MFDVGKTRMIDEKNCDDILSLFHLVPKRNGQTDGQTDRQTDLLYQYRASVCLRAIKTLNYKCHYVSLLKDKTEMIRDKTLLSIVSGSTMSCDSPLRS